MFIKTYKFLPNFFITRYARFIRFNWTVYVNQYPELQSTLQDERSALFHWLTEGKAKNLDHRWQLVDRKRPKVPKRFLITTTQRSGSNLICAALSRSNSAGFNGSNFEMLHHYYDNIDQYPDFHYAEIQDIFDACFIETEIRRIQGFKLMWSQIVFLGTENKTLPTNEEPYCTDEVFKSVKADKFVYLKRRNKILQAVSHLKMDVTGIVSNRHVQASVKPKFTYEELDIKYKRVNRAYYQWDKFYKNNNIVPLTIYYEDMIKDFDYHIATILNYVGAQVPENFVAQKKLKKIGSMYNYIWYLRFLVLKSLERLHRRIRSKLDSKN